MLEKESGLDNPLAATCLHNLACVFAAKKEYSKAESPLVRSLQIREKLFPPNNPAVIESRQTLAEIYRKINENSKAEAIEKSGG